MHLGEVAGASLAIMAQYNKKCLVTGCHSASLAETVEIDENVDFDVSIYFTVFGKTMELTVPGVPVPGRFEAGKWRRCQNRVN